MMMAPFAHNFLVIGFLEIGFGENVSTGWLFGEACILSGEDIMVSVVHISLTN